MNFSLIPVLFFFLFCPQKENRKLYPEKQILFDGKMVEVSVEKTLYISSASPSFLCKFIIRNKTGKTIAADLREYHKVFYPNQYGIYPGPERTEINERSIVPDSLSKKKKEELKKAFAAKSLRFIQPNESVFYYRDFNSGKKENTQPKKGEFFIVSIDGQLFITDGKSDFERAHIPSDKTNIRDIVIPYPVTYGNIPDKSHVLKNK